MGVVPPLDEAEWRDDFLLYQQFPEYKLKNLHMSLEEFKSIFWFEYAHRLLGRFIGVLFLVPFLYFLVRGWLDRSLALKLAGMFLLGGMQGLMGWYMVKSGLVNDPHVSQYRLTAHLALAVIVYSYIFWVALGLLFERVEFPPGDGGNRAALARFSLFITALVFVTMLSGGFVAGTKAGFTFNTFPLMAGRFYPEGMYLLQPWWRNWFENIATIQFNHRLLATLLFAIVPLFWWRARRVAWNPSVGIGVHLLLAALLLQIGLGITTLLLAVPVPVAAAHQAGALLLFTIALYLSNRLAGINASSGNWQTGGSRSFSEQ